MTSDDVTWIDYDPHRVHLPTNAPHVHVRGTDQCLRSPGEACLSGEALRARVAELEDEVERLWQGGSMERANEFLRRAESAEAERDRLRAIVTEAALETYTPDGSERFVGAFHKVLAERDALQQQVDAILGQVNHACNLLMLSGGMAAAATVKRQVARWPDFTTTALGDPAAPPQEPQPTPEAECDGTDWCDATTHTDKCWSRNDAARQQDEEAQG